MFFLLFHSSVLGVTNILYESTLIFYIGETESIPSESATGSAINIFFYNVEVVNNVTKIVLEWTLGSEKKTQVNKEYIYEMFLER